MTLYFIRGTFSNFCSKVHADDMGAYLHDHVHMVFDEQYRKIEIAVNFAGQIAFSGCLCCRSGLVS